MLIFGAIIIINFVCFHYAVHARMYVINVCFRRSPRWGGVYAFSSNSSARLPCTEDKLFVLYWMYKLRCVEVSLVLTFYLSLLVNRSETVKPVAAVCVWRASDVRVWECESANMRHVNWRWEQSIDSDFIAMKPHCAISSASLQQWPTSHQSQWWYRG
jgi:hypothetical protein